MRRQSPADSLTISRLRRWSVYFSGVVVIFTGLLILAALLVLAGWQWDIGIFKRSWLGLEVMNPVTAMTFLVSGLSLLVLTRRRTAHWDIIGRALAVVVLSAGVLRLLSVWWPGFWRVDYLLYSDQILLDIRHHAATPRTMSPSTAITFVLSGAALMLLPVRRRSATTAAQSIAVVVGLIGLFTLICYLYGVKELDIPTVTLPMALHSTVGFLLLSLGILFARPGKGIMRQVTGPYIGS
ncbi:MAG TPA: hypothetical protein VGR89_10045, partial [Puia sp.]|nr:hypothetical protein [Puia sp.]